MDWSKSSRKLKSFTLDKVIRALVCVMTFTCVSYFAGADFRSSQQLMFILGSIVMFSLMVDNIWVSLFAIWSVFLYGFFKFQIGGMYLNNIFSGVILYMIIKNTFKREHIDFYIKVLLCLVIANMSLMVLQTLGLDPVFNNNSNDPVGFMGFKACMGILVAMAIPILYSRGNLWSKIASLALFVPVLRSESSICVLGAGLGLLWCLFWRNRRIFYCLLIPIIIFAMFYAFKLDSVKTSIDYRKEQWQNTIKDATIHPITGWGLDSFATVTAKKQFLYSHAAMTQDDKGKQSIYVDVWDNPHNLYVSLFFEWGIFGLVLLFGYLSGLVSSFRKSIKSNNLIGLAGAIVVFLAVSMAQFPMFLARCVVFIIPIFALFEIESQPE